MIRKIEAQMNDAILNRKDWQSGNTKVIYSPEREASYVMLHGNHIATVGEDFIELYSCGYRTATTKARLNAVLDENGAGERIYQKNFQWFISTNDGDVPFVDGIILR